MLEVSRPDIPIDCLQEFDVRKRFIKLPIQNYLSLLRDESGKPIELLKPQIALVNALNNPKYRYVVAALSRRTGKTFISNVVAQLLAFQPSANILIMAPNYSLSTISWELQRSFLKKFDIELVRANAKDKVLELPNEATIRMGSVSQADSVVGRSYDFILFDEAALDDRGVDAFNIQLRPTLDKLNSKAVFISTPRGKNWFYDFYMRGFNEELPEWVSIHSDYRENPRVSLADIEEAKKTLSKAQFAQEYLAEFTSLEGRAWEFDRDLYVVDMQLDNVQDVISGLDVGFRDPTAYCVIQTDGHNFYIIDEYLEAEATTSKHASAIKSLENKNDVDFTYIDSANPQTAFDFAMNYDIATIKARKSVVDGVGYVASLIEQGRLFVHPRCVNCIASLENLRWDTREGLTKEKLKHDEYIHMGDAIRYALYSHSLNVDVI